jgi:hypothetical protein
MHHLCNETFILLFSLTFADVKRLCHFYNDSTTKTNKVIMSLESQAIVFIAPKSGFQPLNIPAIEFSLKIIALIIRTNFTQHLHNLCNNFF